jgi:uncharacterized protein
MKFENAFTVQAPIEDVWPTLMDVEHVAPCMPGAEVLARVGENAYKVAINVRLGPISMTYRGQVEIIERDDAARRATTHAKAKETRGQGTADAHIYVSLVDQPQGTRATIETELQLSGRAAAMGQGVIADVAERLVETFAANLAEMLVAQPAGVISAPDVIAAEGAVPLANAATSSPPPPLAPPRVAPVHDSLPAGKIAASVIADRLSDARTLLITTATIAFAFGVIGYAFGRARWRGSRA